MTSAAADLAAAPGAPAPAWLAVRREELALLAAGYSAEELREDLPLHTLLRELAASGAPLISGVLVTDAAGSTLLASYEFPARQVDLSGRDYIRALRRGERRLGAELAAALPDSIADVNGPADYRRHVAGVQIDRLLARAATDQAGAAQ